MAIGVEFPVLNPQRFVPLGGSLPANYHFTHFDQDWFVNTLLPWQNKVSPYQLVQLDQRVTIQVHLPQDFNSIELYKVSCKGVQTRIDTDTNVFNDSVVLGGNIYDDHGNIAPVQLTTWQWSFIANDVFTEGVWYLLVKAEMSDVTLQYISEPNLVKADHPGTLLIQYSNSVNDKDIAFSLNPRFEIRLDGYLDNLQPGRETTSFRDEMTDLRQLESHSYRIFDLNLGAVDAPIPEYAIDKVRAIMDMDSIYLDGKRFVMNSDGDISITDYKYNAVKPVKIPVVEYWPEDAGKFYQPSQIKLFDEGSYPYIVSRLEITGPGGTIILSELVEIFNSTQQTALLNSYNTTIVSIYGLTGTFVDTGTSFDYQNGTGESYSTTRSDVYRPTIFAVTSSLGHTGAQFSINGIAGNEVIVSVYTAAGASTFGAQRYLTVGAYSITKVLPLAGSPPTAPVNYIMYVYNNDKMTRMYYGGSGMPLTSSITGLISSALTQFRLRNATMTTISMDFLRRASFTLQSMIFERGDATTISTTAWDTLAVGEWANLISLAFNDNSLTDATQDKIYNDWFLKVAISYLNAGTITTADQSPASAPTVGSDLNRSALSFKGWTLIF